MSSKSSAASLKSGTSSQRRSHSFLVRQVEMSYSLAIQGIENSSAQVKPVAEAKAKVIFRAETKATSKANPKYSVDGTERPVGNLVALHRLGIVVEVEESLSYIDVVKARKEHFARDLRKQSDRMLVEPDPEVFTDEYGNVVGL